MTSLQKRIFFILLAIGSLYFILFIPPNNTGADDQMMISLFEPDEFAQYPIAEKMVAPAESLKQALINFLIYGHYYYGWTFYAASALLVLIGTSLQQDMLLLRQFISVLPMLGALLLLVIVPLSELFRANVGAPDQMRTVMRALLTSAHFFNADNRACMMMSPADLMIGMVRKLKFTFPSESTRLEARYRMFLDIYYICVNCEQNLFDPPNVAGFPAYHQSPQFDEIWVDSASYASRNFAVQGLIGQGFNTGTDFYEQASRNVSIKPDYVGIVGEFTNPSVPGNVIDGCAELLYATPISQGIKDTLKTQRLLLGQQSDVYWTEPYDLYLANPNTTDQTAQMVPNLINFLMLDMAKAAETQLF